MYLQSQPKTLVEHWLIGLGKNPQKEIINQKERKNNLGYVHWFVVDVDKIELEDLENPDLDIIIQIYEDSDKK